MDAAQDTNRLAYIARECATMAAPAELRPPAGRTLSAFGKNGRLVRMSVREALALLGPGPRFRIVLSPSGGSVDLPRLAREFMEKSFSGPDGCGRRPRAWVFACHWNTAHPHVHIVATREALTKREQRHGLLHFGRGYVSSTARKDASLILLGMCAEGTRRLEASRLALEACKPGPIAADTLIARSTLRGKDGVLRLARPVIDLMPASRRKGVEARLAYLAVSGLATCEPDGSFRLEDGWRARLAVERRMRSFGMKADGIIVDGPGSPAYEGTVKAHVVVNDFTDETDMLIQDDGGRLHLFGQKVSPSAEPGLDGARVSIVPKRYFGEDLPRIADMESVIARAGAVVEERGGRPVVPERTAGRPMAREVFQRSTTPSLDG